jgi:hypothetical protein
LGVKVAYIYSKEELAPLAQVNVESLKDFDYFTFVHFEGEDDKPLKLKPPIDYAIDYDRSVLTLHFTLPLENPVDTHGKPVAVDVTTRPSSSPSASQRRSPSLWWGPIRKAARPRLSLLTRRLRPTPRP